MVVAPHVPWPRVGAAHLSPARRDRLGGAGGGGAGDCVAVPGGGGGAVDVGKKGEGRERKREQIGRAHV